MATLIALEPVIERIEEYIDEYSEVDANGWHNPKWCAMEEAKMVLEQAPFVYAVPIRPLARWLAGYAMPPKNYYSGIRADAEERAKAWELWIRNLMENGGLDSVE